MGVAITWALTGCVDASGGGFDATWSITISGASAACADVGATQVSVLSTRVGTSSGNDDIFTCDDGGGLTDTYDAGDYVIVATLLDDTSAEVSNPTAPVTVSITDGEDTPISIECAY
jgi:hypothetical protein